RPSVRITSKEYIYHGLLILDAIHLPYGKGLWPAFWTLGEHWPYGGEIDIIEGIGDSAQNLVSYHTGPDVCHYNPNVTQSASCKPGGTNCDSFATKNQGCASIDPSTTSYGRGANLVYGGVWAMEWTSQYVKTWHFDRSNIPEDLLYGQPQPQRWGYPVSYLDNRTCNINSAFGPQKVVLNIELCGDWAGPAFEGGPKACVDYVQRNPQEFASAYFEIRSLQYYQYAEDLA
ncbi:glycoside hydrolase family 16 protein, partial [Sphaerobolus stellatus SS14]